MFRELNQKKQNIITLVLTVGYIILVLCLPFVVGGTLSTIKYRQPHEVVANIKEANIESLTPEKPVQKIEIKKKKPKKKKKKPQNTQTDVKSEVINEYFDDAHGTGLAVPSVNTSFKSYTYYTALSKSSIQWKLQEKAYSDKNGLRKIGNYYLAAMGSYYSTKIGDTFRITTDKGNTFDIILCDAKSDRHTDKQHMYTVSNNCMVEFYVDGKTLNSTVKRMGSVGALPKFSGRIIKVKYLGFYKWK